MSTPRCDIHPRLRKILDASGHTWTLEHRKRHMLLRIEGEVVLSLPAGRRDTSGGRHWENALACVRRSLRALGVPAEYLR